MAKSIRRSPSRKSDSQVFKKGVKNYKGKNREDNWTKRSGKDIIPSPKGKDLVKIYCDSEGVKSVNRLGPGWRSQEQLLNVKQIKKVLEANKKKKKLDLRSRFRFNSEPVLDFV